MAKPDLNAALSSADEYIKDLERTRDRVEAFKADGIGLSLEDFKRGVEAKRNDPDAPWPPTKSIKSS